MLLEAKGLVHALPNKKYHWGRFCDYAMDLYWNIWVHKWEELLVNCNYVKWKVFTQNLIIMLWRTLKNRQGWKRLLPHKSSRWRKAWTHPPLELCIGRQAPYKGHELLGEDGKCKMTPRPKAEAGEIFVASKPMYSSSDSFPENSNSSEKHTKLLLYLIKEPLMEQNFTSMLALK